MFSLRNRVQVRQLGGGHLLLVGLADPRTQHMARLVASQRENTEGYNYRTGAVSPFPTKGSHPFKFQLEMGCCPNGFRTT